MKLQLLLLTSNTSQIMQVTQVWENNHMKNSVLVVHIDTVSSLSVHGFILLQIETTTFIYLRQQKT